MSKLLISIQVIFNISHTCVLTILINGLFYNPNITQILLIIIGLCLLIFSSVIVNYVLFNEIREYKSAENWLNGKEEIERIEPKYYNENTEDEEK